MKPSIENIFGSWRPQAVGFDCDGLLMDTEPCWTIAETELFARRGLEFGLDQKALVIGKSLVHASETIAELFGETAEAASIESELLNLVAKSVTETAVAMPGANEIVEMVGGLMPMAVASNSTRELLNAALDRGGFANAFEISVAADEVVAPKPDPEMYLKACQRLGIPASDVLAFEDSMTGLASARAAGVKVIGVPTLRHDNFPAEYVTETLTDRDLSAWLSNASR